MREGARRAALVFLLACAGEGFAAHPLVSEDTGTQGAGRFELELGNTWTRNGGDRAYEFGPQLSYGILPNLDAIVRPTLLVLLMSGEGPATTRVRGAGDTAVDVKWRFHEADRLSFATRAGIGVPTGSAARGLGAGKTTYHVVGVASFDAAPLAFHGNLGYTRAADGAFERRDLFHASTAGVVKIKGGWQLLLYDIAVDSNPDRSRSVAPAIARSGAIYTLREGCDIDVGYQTRLNHAAPMNAFLAGLTVRW